MSRMLRYILPSCLCLLATPLARAQSSSQGQDDVSGQSKEFLYTNANTAQNAVYGFRIERDGALNALPGSPFRTGGAGVPSVPLVSDHSVLADNQSQRLFAANPASKDVAVFDVRGDGALTSVRGSPFTTGGGGTLVSLALSKDVLYTAHNTPTFDDCSGCGYRGFRVARNGQITAILSAVYPTGKQPASLPVSIEFDATGKILVGSRFSFDLTSPGANSIQTFTLEPAGTLHNAPGSPFQTSVAARNTQPFSFAFNPANPTQLFSGNSVDFTTSPTGTVAGYLLAETGQLAALPQGAVNSTGQINTAWVALTHDGEDLYASNSASDSISHFKVDEAGRLTFVAAVTVLDNNVYDGPRSLVVSERDRFLYVVNGRGGQDGNNGSLVGFAIQADGSLKRLDKYVVLKGVKPFGLAHVVRGSR